MKQRAYNIDSLKILCAFLVIFIHVYTPYREYIVPVARCAVPCFFIISGYFIFSEDQKAFSCHLYRGMKRTFQLFLWSSLLFAIVKILSAAFNDEDFSFLSWWALCKFICLNDNPFGYHLWYVGAYLYTLAIVWFFIRKNKLKWLYVVVPVLLLADLCLGKYSLVLWGREFPNILTRNFLCVGIPYFMIGTLIKHYKVRFLSYQRLRLLTLGGVILFSLTNIMENRLLTEADMNATRDHYISSTFLAISLFLYFLYFKQTKSNFISDLGEKDSLYVYIFHPLIIMIFPILREVMPMLWSDFYISYWIPLVILMASIVLSRILRAVHVIK